MSDTNQQAYTSASLVWHYTQLSTLQPAEQAILERFQSQLPTMKMLDIGIGGGRTTQHFSPLAGEYTGIDYSAEMIAACQKRFADSPQSMALEVCDARDMSQFADQSFDFILFSFNGIDYVSHSDRLQVLAEISRIIKQGGYFCFSSHSLQGMAIAVNCKNQVSLNPLTTYVNFVMLALLKLFNATITREQLRTASHLIIKDESHNFRLRTYYVRPQEQVKQLESRFNRIEIYSWQSGLRLVDPELAANDDLWLYYLCVANGVANGVADSAANH